jgi:hypothetical protein
MSTNQRTLDDGKSPDEYTDPNLREATETVVERTVNTLAGDAVEGIVPMMPIVLPMLGAVLMFLLAFIAIYMA